MKESANLSDLIVAIDPGASAIKVVASLADDEICYPFTIEPNCVDLDTFTKAIVFPNLILTLTKTLSGLELVVKIMRLVL